MIQSLTREEYDAIDAVNFSTLKWMSVSPARYLYATTHQEPDRAAFVRGRSAHAAVFEPATFDARFVVYPGATRRGKEFDAFARANQGNEIVTAKERSLAVAISAAVRAHPIASALLDTVIATEQTVTWIDPVTGANCKGRVDGRAPTSVIELKTTKCALPRIFAADAARRYYHAQLAMYCDGCGCNDGCIIAVEATAPHTVVVYHVAPDHVGDDGLPVAGPLDAGRDVYRQWLDRRAECTASGVWAGVADGVVEMELPAWAVDVPTVPLDLDGEEL